MTAAIAAALRSGGVFLDIGANIGYFATLAARVVGSSGLVVAFEPNPEARRALVEAVALNGAAAIVEVVPLALADRDEEVTLFTTPGHSSYSTLDPAASPMREVATFRGAEQVRTTTLDGWLAGRPDLTGRIHCIKIDVEGVEARVLRGMARLLATAKPAIVCETWIGSDADRLLEAAGFDRCRIEPGADAYGNFLYRA